MCVGEAISVHIICAEKDTFEEDHRYGPLFYKRVKGEAVA